MARTVWRVNGGQAAINAATASIRHPPLAKDRINLVVDSLSTLPAEDQIQFAKNLEMLIHNLLLRVAASRGSSKMRNISP
jgi:hypothetical protein